MLNKLLILCLLISFQSENTKYSVDDLTGRSSPVFYGENFKLQKDAYDAFLLMQEEALKSDIKIHVVSSYRSYEHQKRIWTRKYQRFVVDSLTPKHAIRKIIEYSTIPGTSRHHWGTDLDIIDANVVQPKNVLNVKHFEGEGVFVKLKNWLDENSEEFGFYLVYTNDSVRKGFKYEPWHFSYKPISKEMLSEYVKIDIQALLKEDKLVGSQNFTDEFISQYINGNILDINPDLKK